MKKMENVKADKLLRNLNGLSVKQTLIGGFLLFVVLTSALGGISYFTLNGIVTKDNPAALMKEHIQEEMLELRKNEKDFQLGS